MTQQSEMPAITDGIRILNDVRDIHGNESGRCVECGHAYPCRTAKYVNDVLARRFE